MADLTVDKTKVAVLNNTPSVRLAAFAGEDMDAGQLVYIKAADGKAYKADANGSGTTRCAGMALEPVKAGNAFTRLVLGGVGMGSALASLSADAPVYVSNNPGLISDTKAASEQQVGLVATLTDGKTPTKYLWIDCSLH